MKIKLLMDKVGKYIKREDYLKMIEKSFEFAKEKHAGQVRKSGEEFIMHPLEVAITLSDLKIGPFSICAGLLHDVLEDTDTTKKELEENFNVEIADIVEGVTKLTNTDFESEEDKLKSNHKKILLAMSKDIRVVIVKLADRLHNMRTLKFMKPEKQVSVSKETLDIYTPLAHRLGMQQMRSELEDIAIKYIDPSSFASIKERLSMKQETRRKIAETMTTDCKELMEENNVAFVDVFNRVKNIYSIDKKMKSQSKNFDDIYDLLAIRLIVRDVPECYRVLGIVHSRWKPIPNRFKDYIAMPKPNMYQSLHTTIVGNEGNIFEVQIRTKDMNDIAEYGVAEHWKYKELANDEKPIQVDPKLKWYTDFKLKAEEEDMNDVIGELKGDLFKANVYVFTPKGDVMDFPKGSTPLDFAFRIHSEVGSKMTSAIVNGRKTTLDYKLKTGDVVKVITGEENKINRNWLSMVQTSAAKNRIRVFLNKQDKDLYLTKGQLEFNMHLNEMNLDVKFTDALIEEKLTDENIKTEEELFIAIGKGNLDSKNTICLLYGLEVSCDIPAANRTENVCQSLGIKVPSIETPNVEISKCCFPIPGDEIIGLGTNADGELMIHRCDCKSVKKDSKDKLEAEWDKTNNIVYQTALEIEINNIQGVVSKVVNSISNMGYNIVAINAFQTTDISGKIRVVIEVNNKRELDVLLKIVRTIREIKTVKRELL